MIAPGLLFGPIWLPFGGHFGCQNRIISVSIFDSKITPKWTPNRSKKHSRSTPGAITFPYKTFLGTRVASRAHLDVIWGIFWATWASFLQKTKRLSHVCCWNVWENTCVWHSKAVQNAFQIPFYMNIFCRARVACPAAPTTINKVWLTPNDKNRSASFKARAAVLQPPGVLVYIYTAVYHIYIYI